MNELLATIGGSWRQVIVYPGGVAFWIIVVVMRRLWGASAPAGAWAATQIVTAWLCVALQPWPHTYWAYGLDLWAALLLLEVPQWLRHRTASPAARATDWHRLRRAYALLALALVLMAQGAQSLLLTTIQTATDPLRWLGVAVWIIALPPLLALGPWRGTDEADTAATTRRVAHIALAVVLAWPPVEKLGYPAAALAITVACAAYAALHHWWHGEPQRWERWQPWLAGVALLGLAWAAVSAYVRQLW